MDLTRVLSDFAAGLKYEDLDRRTVETTKMFIADYIAACIAGYAVNSDFNKAVMAVARGASRTGKASVFFEGRGYEASDAAFMNAIYAHGADMDDGNRKAMGHVGAHVISAVFAYAQELDIKDWKRIFTAINVGYEVYNRIAAAVQPGLVRRGFHSTGTAGTVACAASAAKLLDLDSDGIYNAMAIAAIQASGLLIIAESAQSCKPLNPANAARTGIISAKLSSKGVSGPVNPLESSKGWFHAMSESYDENAVLEDLGKKFTICESYLKPYPSCRHTHCAIEAGLRIHERMQADGFRYGDIEAVRVNIYENAIKIAGQIRIPSGAEESKFSIHYTLACALCGGRFTLTELDPESAPEGAKELTSLIELISDPSMEDVNAGVRGASVEVCAGKDGKIYRETVMLPKGEADNPFTWEDMKQKMTECSAYAGSRYDAAGIVSMLRGLDPENEEAELSRLIIS